MLLRLSLAITLLAGLLIGQTGTSRIRGVIKDTTGAVVPGATVLIKHDDTGLERTLTSNPSGQYSFEALPLGKYTITVSFQGFKKVTSGGNELQVGEPLTVDVTLEPGTLSEQVMVSETSTQVQT